MRHALPATLLLAFTIALACGGAAPDPGSAADERGAEGGPGTDAGDAASQGEILPLRMVGSSSWTWPREDLAGSAVLAADGDASTVWTAAEGETAVFFVSGTPSSVQVSGGRQVRLWTQGKKRWIPEIGEWTPIGEEPLPLSATGRILGVEVQAAGPVHSIMIRGKTAKPTTAHWELSLTAAAGEPFVDWHAAKIGTIDLQACSVRKPMAGPGEAFDGRCELTDDALVLEGNIGGVGPIDERLPVHDIGPCLKVVGGWPYTRCQ